MPLRKELRCSFCGKTAAEVSKLVAGPKVYICDECVGVAARIMGGGSPPESPISDRSTSVLERFKNHWRQLLRSGMRRGATVVSTL